MTASKSNSPAAMRASRINGARSKGPRSLAGKRASARNSLKHGLFRTGPGIGEALSPSLAKFAGELRALSDDHWEAGALVESALDAAIRLERAEGLARRTREEVAVLLAGDAVASEFLSHRLEELIRFARYERRLRGRRDRATRKLIALAAERAC